MNEAMFDTWSWGHIALGFVCKRAGFSFPTVLVIAIGWELIEPSLKTSNPDLFPHPSIDSNANKFGDILSVLLGYYAGGRV